MSNLIINPYVFSSGIPQDYVAHWTMDNISGSTLVDESANSNDGAISGATAVSGYINNALSFDGTNDEVDIANSTSMATGGAFTLSLFANVGTVAASAVIINHGLTDASGGQVYVYMVDGKFQVGVRDQSNVDSGVNISTGQYYHLGITYDGTSIRFYTGGSLKNTQARTVNIINGKTNLGHYQNPSTLAKALWADVDIDHAYIYDYAVTDAQMAALAGET